MNRHICSGLFGITLLALLACTVLADDQKLRFDNHVEIERLNGLSPPTTTSSFANVTTTSPNSTNVTSSWQGYVGAGIAIVFFGSSFVPLKKFETGDGMFFQWILCSAIWLAGLITNCATGFKEFYPLCMLGGFLWATGNICVVPIVKTIGLGLGMLIWGSFNLLAGWSTSRFGFFGLTKEIPSDPAMNYVAIALAMMSAVCWLFVKSDGRGAAVELPDDDEDAPLVDDAEEESLHDDGESWVDKLSPTSRRVVGSVLSVVSGIFYGMNFVPVIYVKNKYHNAPQNDTDYVFAHFSGIYITSSLYFFVYCAYMRNNPKVYPQAILPGILSGWIWAIAQIGWFVANRYLSAAISFPIITTGPGIVGSLWGVFVFREVRGLRNYIIMGIAYCFTITGAVLAGFSH